MKVDIIKTPPFVNRWVIDERGFKKLGSKPLNNAQTAPSSVSGQGKNSQKRSLGVQPLISMKGVNNADKILI